ncbi:MAG: ABC transporter substrate-binding protein [Lachnospiraceae bacterium]|nr:ABC transporter substrate-binding protein [Lachnospiraceae bacterium]
MKRIMFKKACLFGLAFMLAVAPCACAGDKEGKASDSITIGIQQDIEESLDPHDMLAAGTKEIFFNVFEGLVKSDSEGNIVPAVASSVVKSDDGCTYTFELREGIKFHDGTTVTADDIEYSVNKFADIENHNPSISAFSIVKEVNVKDEKTVEIVLTEPNNEFLSNLATVEAAIIPKNNANPDGIAIGTGPYKYVSRTPMENVKMEKFEDYWGEKASIKNVTFKICTNTDTIPMELKGGNIDMITHLTNAQRLQIDADNFVVYEGTMNLVQALYLNQNFEPFKDVRVRQALCYAIDKKEILTFVSDGRGTPIGSSIYPNFGKYYEDLSNMYPHDTEKAKELLKEAGYPDGFSFTVTAPSNYPQHVDTAQVMAEEFKAIGVTMDISIVDWDTWLSETYVGRNFDATVIGVDAAQLTADSLLSRFESSAGDNFINYSNPEYDKAYSTALKENDDEKQTEDYKQCAKILAEDAANVYVQDLPEFVAMNKRFEGYVFYPMYVMDISKIKPVEQ